MSRLIRRCWEFAKPTMARRIVAGCLVCLYSWVTIGVPLPIVVSVKRSAERFPCESCPCGCVSAEQCWRLCCCHTLSERLDWAKRNGVEPPEEVVRNARLQALADFTATGKLPTCCQTTTKSTQPERCVAKSRTKSKPLCCSAKSNEKTEDTSDTIVAWRVLECQGQTMNWLTVSTTTIPMQIVMSDLLPPVAWARPIGDFLSAGRCDEPAIPPPQCA